MDQANSTVDPAISGDQEKGKRTLQRWISETPTAMDLEDPLYLLDSKPADPWNQFAANEKLFGLKTDYDENIYTTTIDKSHPQYKERLAKADKLFAETTKNTATNVSVSVERIIDNLASEQSSGQSQGLWELAEKFAAAQHAITERREERYQTEKEKKLNELKAFANSFKLSTSMPADLAFILKKDKRKGEKELDELKVFADSFRPPTSVPAELDFIHEKDDRESKNTPQETFQDQSLQERYLNEPNLPGETSFAEDSFPDSGSVSEVHVTTLSGAQWTSNSKKKTPFPDLSVPSQPATQTLDVLGTQSIFGGGSTAETMTNTFKSRKSTTPPQSTVPTSVFDVQSSKKLKHVALQERFAEGTNTLVINEDLKQTMIQDADRDGQSSISSVTILDPKQRKVIVKKFIEAILKDLACAPSVSHDYTQSRITFQQRFQILLKNYSDQVKNDAGQRTRRQAAKQIRSLRHEISEKFEEAFRGFSSKEQRVYPHIAKQADIFNPPEKRWAEKVGDWSEFLSKETPLLERIVDDQQYEFQVQCQSETLDTEDAKPASHPASLSDFDHAGSSSESEMDEVVHTTPGEDKEIYDFLTTHHAFKELVVDLQQLVERHYSNHMEVIRNRILLALQRPIDKDKHEPSRHVAMFYLDWGILTFLQEQYPFGLAQDLGSVLTITGQATDAYMSTIRNYLQGFWPSYPSVLLDAIQGAISNYPREETSGSILSSGPESNIIVNLLEESLLVTGSQDFLVAVAQQISWLVSACRVLPLTSDDPGSCWNEVVGTSTIVTGFPIPPRHNSEKGLEVPLQVMAGLGGVPLATQFDGGYLLKARSLAFVPVERTEESVQWHLLKKEGSRMRYKDIADLCPVRLRVETLDQDDLLSTRAFLGWCADSTNSLGTIHADYSCIGFSNTNRPSKQVVALTGVSVGFGHIGTGQANFTFGAHNSAYTADKPSYYLDVLDDAKQIHVILQDMEQRRAWHTDGERAILHMILHRQAIGAYKIEGKAIELQTADLESPDSVRIAMTGNANVVVVHDQHMDKRDVGTKLFKDLVGDLYARLEGLEENAKKIIRAGIELKLD
ncbi:hypothetical protein EG329_002178 [Mollisiaceae sp. DMI_Dod_QoI]|nr:hypothetical protein EG329_002178 [Helotiales sp. DMI_Dod_QoI]